MNKQISIIVGVVAILAVFTVAGVVYANNYYYGNTTVNQDSEDTQVDTGEMDMGISDRSGGFVITKKITNSDIATSSVNMYEGLDLTNTVMGALIVDDIVISADSSGLATSSPGTENQCSGIKIVVRGNSASTTVMTNSIGMLEGNETIDMANASSSIHTRLDEGSKLQVLPLTTPCIDDGETTFTMFFKKVDERSLIYE